MRVVVLGIGNLLMSDEGVGVHAAWALQEAFVLPSEVEVVDGGTTGMELLPELEDLDHLIVIDAVRLGKPPGTVARLVGDDVPAFFKTKLSPHQVGLSDILATLRFAGRSPGRIVLIGIEPASLEMGMALSAAVAPRVDEVVALLVGELTAIGLTMERRA